MHKSDLPSSATSVPTQRGRGRPRAFDREAALDHATRLFWLKGYEATSIYDLTEAMGIGSTSLYSAFGSKDELYAEALQHYYRTYEGFILANFRKARTAREATMAYLFDSAAALTGSIADVPRGCMATLATVGSEGHAGLSELMRSARAGVYDLLRLRFEKAVVDGDLPPSVDISGLARFVHTVQSGMSIRARDGADQAELESVADIAMSGWDGFVLASGAA